MDKIKTMDPLPELIVASGSLPPGVPDEFYGWLARLVRERGGRLILDTSGRALAAAVKEGVFLIKPSLRELAALSHESVEHEPEQESAALQIIETGQCEAVVVSLGPAGVLLVSRDGCERMRSPTVPVRSRVGAGDSMVAGIALSLANDFPLGEAVRFGVAAGAAAVMNPGTELCHHPDVERLFRQISVEAHRTASPFPSASHPIVQAALGRAR